MLVVPARLHPDRVVPPGCRDGDGVRGKPDLCGQEPRWYDHLERVDDEDVPAYGEEARGRGKGKAPATI